MEIRQHALSNIEGLLSWAIVQTLLISVMQALHASDVFPESDLVGQEILVHDLLQLRKTQSAIFLLPTKNHSYLDVVPNVDQ